MYSDVCLLRVLKICIYHTMVALYIREKWMLKNSLKRISNGTRRMAIANGTSVSFCNQPRHIIWLPHESRQYVVAGCRNLATSRESKAHFGLPWVRPWDNRSKCYMDQKTIQCLSNASQHVPIYTYLQPFPSNSSRKFESSPFLHNMFSRFDTIPACDRQTDGRPAYS